MRWGDRGDANDGLERLGVGEEVLLVRVELLVVVF